VEGGALRGPTENISMFYEPFIVDSTRARTLLGLEATPFVRRLATPSHGIGRMAWEPDTAASSGPQRRVVRDGAVTSVEGM
jgi:hypothetical protein